ncbi:MAG: hypothetical protein PF508_15165 [Spirochaeta sp.]|jgi:uncharacterized protein (TIGR03545 family)|nr:hypothetical protein [Spirochaeta sp.]
MARTLPKKFRKPIPEKKFSRRVLGRIHLDRDRSFVEQVFVRREDGTYLLDETLTAEDTRRLVGVLREIKKNRGLLRTGRLAIVAIIIGAAVIFGVFFKDRLVKDAAESFLELTFGARSEIAELQFRPFRGTVSIRDVTVADRDRPMTNLFVLESTMLSVNTVELLKGNVVISEMSADGLAFGTARETSGALERRDDDRRGADNDGGGGQTAERAAGAAGDTARSAAAGLGLTAEMLDPAALIANEVDNLQSLAVAESLVAEAETTKATVARAVSDAEETGATIRREAEAVLQRDVTEISDLNTLRDTYQELERTGETVRTLSGDIRETTELVRQQTGRLSDAGTRIEAAVAADMARLREQIPTRDLDPREFALTMVRTFLEESLGSTYDRGMAVVTRLQALRRETPQGSDAPGRGGVDIVFSSAVYPRFSIAEARLSGRSGAADLAINIAHISSDPEITGEPVTFTYTGRGEPSTVEITGRIDLRDGAENLATYSMSVDNVNPPLPAAAAGLGFAAFGGSGFVQSDGTFTDAETLGGTVAFRVEQPAFSVTDEAGAAVQIVADALNDTDQLDADLTYRVSGGTLTELSGSTSLATLLRERVDALIAELRADVEARVRAELETRLAAYLGPYRETVDELLEQTGVAESVLDDAQAYTAAVANAREAAEQRLADMRSEAEARVREEAEREIQERTEQAQDEVEERAREQADSLREGLQVPGF